MLTNQVFIITGASSGIGAATAIEAARNGMDVVITARREDRLRAVAERVQSFGRRAEVVAGDVGEAGLSDRLLDAAQRAFGRFDAVFANAGYGQEFSMLEISAADFREMFDVNFYSGMDLLQKAARGMIAANRTGHLLMCSSCLAKFTLPGSGVYCATKATQNHFCRALRMELKPRRIHVASVHPIGTRTEFFEQSAKRTGTTPDDPPGLFMQSPERVARAVIACLKRPRPEVWTSLMVRFSAGLMTMMPRLGDVAMRVSGHHAPPQGVDARDRR